MLPRRRRCVAEKSAGILPHCHALPKSGL